MQFGASRILEMSNTKMFIVALSVAAPVAILLGHKTWKRVKLAQQTLGLTASGTINMLKTRDIVVNCFFGPSNGAVLHAAFETGIWRAIANNPLTLEEIATSTKATLNGARCVCEYLWSINLIKRGADRKYFHKYDESFTKFVETKITYFHHVAHRQLYHLAESCMTDTPIGLQHFNEVDDLYKSRTSTASLKSWQNFMDDHGHTIIKAFVSQFPYGKYSKVLDVCGNQGVNAIHIQKKFPHLQVTIHDLPSVCLLAEKKLEAEGLRDKISVFGKDLDDADLSFPPGFDLIQMLHCSSEWTTAEITSRARILRESLVVGGDLILVTACTFDTDGRMRNQLKSASLRTPYFVACTKNGGGMHSYEEYSQALTDAGFSKVTYQEIPGNRAELLITAKV